ncbi:myeloid-associated differentiation marker-like protein 2, partial [Anguilla rostrata]|uniref:myeloid-associated differentiation marker-like protein 2 n=1 Tax=Anguilla rostrata TaxID=7938 RepID=UPI0030CFC680
VAVDTPGGHFLNPGALVSAVGVARLCQLALGGALVSLVVHYTGHTGAPYGWLCMAVWSFCLAVTLAIVLLDVTRLHACLSVSWGDLTAAHAALAALLQAAAAALYPVYFLLPGCSWGACGTWRYRVAVSVCACACCLAYAAEVALSWANGGRRPAPYMATPPGLLKVGQACSAGVIFGALANGEYSRHVPARYCVAVYAVCFVATVAVIALTVSGRIGSGTGTGTATRTAAPPPRFPLDRAVAVYTFLATLLYLSAAVVWPIYCFHRSYGAPYRPTGCPRWGGRGRCPWDAHLVVAVFTCLNLLLYLADLACSQRAHTVSQQPLFV